MKRVFVLICMFTSFLFSGVCTDTAFMNTYVQEIKSAFDGYDESITRVIKQINAQLKSTLAGGLEAGNNRTLIDIRKLEKEYALSEKEILYQQQVINRLNGLVIDAEAEAANIRASKKNLRRLK